MREETVTSDTMRFKGAIISSGNTKATVKRGRGVKYRN